MESYAVITLLSRLYMFLFTKDWLPNSLEDRKRTADFNIELLKSELQ